MKADLYLVGIGDDGCLSLTSRAVNAVAMSEVLVGTADQLAFFPQFDGERRLLEMPLRPWLTQLLADTAGRDVTILASGDPLFYGIGQTLAELDYPHQLRVLPNLSSVQLACARLGLPHVGMDRISLHGQVNRDQVPGLVARLQQCNKAAILTDSHSHPVAVAQQLVQFDERGWQVHVCEALGSSEERLTTWTPASLAEQDAAQFQHRNVVILQRTHQRPWQGCRGHRPDNDYLKRTPKQGLITKAPVRAVAVANLALTPDSVVWDIGAGSGSVAIEAAKQAYRAPCFAIECNPDCWPMIEANRVAHKVDNLQLVQSKAPDGLAQLPDPDAVFCGGSRGQLKDLVPQVWSRLKPGGRMVFSAVTLDTLVELQQLTAQHQLPVNRLLLQGAQQREIGRYTSYQGDNPIHLFTFEKPE